MRMKHKKLFLQLCMLFSLSLNLISLGISTPNSISSDPPVTGDWIVNDTSTVTGQKLVMNGSIVVNRSGSLTITDSTIIFAGNAGAVGNGEWNITVLPTGSLTITDSVITTDGVGYIYHLFAEKGSTLHIDNGTFTNIGHSGFDGAIRSETDDTTIENSYIHMYGSDAIRLHNNSGVVISDTEITSNYNVNQFLIYGSSVDGLTVTNCNISTEVASRAVTFIDCSNINLQSNYLLGDMDTTYFTMFLENTNSSIFSNNIFNQTNDFIAIYTSSSDACYDLKFIGNEIYTIGTGTTYAGIRLRNTVNSVFDDNTFHCENQGLISDSSSYHSENLTISGNTFDPTSGSAIEIINHQGVLDISDNVILGADDSAIYVEDTFHLTITGNTIKDVDVLGAGDHSGIELTNCSIATVDSNVISNCGDYGIRYAPEEGKNVEITNNDISFTRNDGIFVDDINGGSISGNSLINVHGNGIQVYSSDNFEVNDNFISDGHQDGIYIYNTNSNFNVTGNHVKNTYSQGIYLYVSITDFEVSNNIIEDCYDGIYLSSTVSLGNTFGNVIKNVDHYGLYLSTTATFVEIYQNVIISSYIGAYCGGDSNRLTNNSFLFNYYGVSIPSSADGTQILLNDFIENQIQAEDDGTNSDWSLNPVSNVYFGNYWSDYDGVDVAAPIGFGDTPYTDIGGTGGFQDDYPLMAVKNPDNTNPPIISHPVDIQFNVGATGYNLIWSPFSFIPNTYSVTISGSTSSSGKWDGSTIVFSLDSLAEGTYTIVCSVTDNLGQSVSDAVSVEVLGSSTTPIGNQTTTTTTGDGPSDLPGDLDLNSTLIGAIGGFVIMGVLLILFKIIRRGK